MPAASRRAAPRKKSAASKNKSAKPDPASARLEFLAGLMLLPPDAKEPDKIAVAERVGLDASAVARIFNKTYDAANQALFRARKA